MKTGLDMLQALGVANQSKGPTKVDDAQASKVMQLCAKYLLYERSEQTALVNAFAMLMQERHHHFHDKANQETKFTDCDNDVCKEGCSIISNTTSKEVYVNPIAAELMGKWRLNFMPMPNNLRFWLTKADETALPETASEQREASRIILPS